jgi:hypothetical protein
MRRATVLWTVLAVCGVLLVAGVTVAASRLSTQTIGLSSEPLSAGDRLAPKATRTSAAPNQKPKRAAQKPKPTATPTATPTPPVATVTAAPPVITDDHGGDDNSGSGSDDSGRGRGRGRGGDDD